MPFSRLLRISLLTILATVVVTVIVRTVAVLLFRVPDSYYFDNLRLDLFQRKETG